MSVARVEPRAMEPIVGDSRGDATYEWARRGPVPVLPDRGAPNRGRPLGIGGREALASVEPEPDPRVPLDPYAAADADAPLDPYVDAEPGASDDVDGDDVVADEGVEDADEGGEAEEEEADEDAGAGTGAAPPEEPIAATDAAAGSGGGGTSNGGAVDEGVAPTSGGEAEAAEGTAEGGTPTGGEGTEEASAGGGEGDAAAVATQDPPARMTVGGTRPPIIGPPPRMDDKTVASIRERTRLRPREHHERVRWALRSVSQAATAAQRRIVKEVEATSDELRQTIEADADRLPAVAAAAIARVRAAVGAAIAAVELAATNARTSIQNHDRDNVTGIDTVVTATVANIETIVAEGGTAITEAYRESMGMYDEVAEMFADEMRAVPGALNPGFVSFVEGIAVRYNAGGVAGHRNRYKRERRAVNLPALAQQGYEALTRGAEARAEQLTSEASRGQIAQQFLAMANPAAVVSETTGAADGADIRGEERRTTTRLASARERALATVASSSTAAIEQLRTGETQLVSGLERAGRMGRAGLRTQARAIDGGLRAMGAQFAQSYRDFMAGFVDMFPPRQFFDYTIHRKRLAKAEKDVDAMYAGQHKALRDRARSSLSEARGTYQAQASQIGTIASTGLQSIETGRQSAVAGVGRVAAQLTGQMLVQAEQVQRQAPEHEAAAREQQEAFADNVSSAMFNAVYVGAEGSPSLVENFAERVDQFREHCEGERDEFETKASAHDGVFGPIDQTTETEYRHGASELRAGVEHEVMGCNATDEDRIFAVFLPLTVKGIWAVEEEYNHRFPSESLYGRLQGELEEDDDEWEAAQNFLLGHRAEAVVALVASAEHWYGDDSSRQINAVRSLNAAERDQLETIEGWADTRRDLLADLSPTNTRIVEAYLEGDRALAISLRMENDVTTARRRGSEDSVVDNLAGMDARIREELALEHRDRLTTDRDVAGMRRDVIRAHAVATNQITADERGALSDERAIELFIAHHTRPIEVLVRSGGGHGHIETRAPTTELRGMIEEVARHGSEAEQTRGARLAYEHRAAERGGLSETRIDRIHSTAEDRRLEAATQAFERAERGGNADEIARAREGLERERTRHDVFIRSYVRRLGRADLADAEDPNAARRFAGDSLATVFEDETAGPDFARELVSRGRPSLLSATLLATHRTGTHESLLEAAYAGRSFEEFQQLRRDYARHIGSSDPHALDRHLGTFGHGGWFTELSGDDRQRIELLMAGEERTDRDRARVAFLRYRHQVDEIGAGGRASMAGSDEEAYIVGTRDRMTELITAAARANGETGALFDERGQPTEAAMNAAFAPDGTLRGANGDDWQEFRSLSLGMRAAADDYKAGVERAEARMLAVIQLIGAVVGVALMFIPGVNVLVAGVIAAVLTGIATIAVKASMRGSRYGYEEVLTDVGMTAVDAATAAFGGSRFLRFGSLGKIGGAMARESITGAISSAANVAMQDETWRDGLAAGFSRVGGGAVRGGVVGAVTAGVSEGVSGGLSRRLGGAADAVGDAANPTALQRLGNRLGTRGRAVITEGIGESIGSMAGETAGIGFDVATGNFRGGLDQALAQIGMAGVRDMMTGGLRSVAMARAAARRDTLQRQILMQDGPPTADQLRALRAFSVQAGRMELLDADGPARLGADIAVSRQLLADIPAELRPRFIDFPPQALSRIRDIVVGGDAGTIEQRRELAGIARELGLETDLARITRDLTEASAASTRARSEGGAAARAIGDLPVELRHHFAGMSESTRNQLVVLPPEALRRAIELVRDGVRPTDDDRAMLARALGDADSAELLRRIDAEVERTQATVASAGAARQRDRGAALADFPAHLRTALGALPDDAIDVVRVLRARGEGLSGAAQVELVRRALLATPGADAAAVLRALGEAVATAPTRTPFDAEAASRARLADVPEDLRGAISAVPEGALLELRIAMALGDLSDSARRFMLEQAQRRDPDVDVEALGRALDDAVRRAPPEVRLSAEEDARLREQLASGVPSDQRAALRGVPIVVLPDDQFAAFTRSASGQAVTLIIEGRPVVVMRRGADAGVLREEGLHALQIQDPRWRAHVELLDERRLARWDEMSVADQLATYHAKLDLEIDAHRRLIAGLEAELATAGSTPHAARLVEMLEDAITALGNLQRRRTEVDAFATAPLEPRPSRPQWLDEPARLFMKRSRGATVEPEIRAAAEALLGRPPHDRELTQTLRDWLRDAPPQDRDLVTRAIAAAGVVEGGKSFADAIVRQLGDPNARDATLALLRVLPPAGAIGSAEFALTRAVTEMLSAPASKVTLSVLPRLTALIGRATSLSTDGAFLREPMLRAATTTLRQSPPPGFTRVGYLDHIADFVARIQTEPASLAVMRDDARVRGIVFATLPWTGAGSTRHPILDLAVRLGGLPPALVDHLDRAVTRTQTPSDTLKLVASMDALARAAAAIPNGPDAARALLGRAFADENYTNPIKGALRILAEAASWSAADQQRLIDYLRDPPDQVDVLAELARLGNRASVGDVRQRLLDETRLLPETESWADTLNNALARVNRLEGPARQEWDTFNARPDLAVLSDIERAFLFPSRHWLDATGGVMALLARLNAGRSAGDTLTSLPRFDPGADGTRARWDDIRRALRANVLADIRPMDAGAVGRLLDRLDQSPDPGSQGQLFHEFMETRLAADGVGPPPMRPVPDKPQRPHIDVREGTGARDVDSLATVGIPTPANGPPPGSFAIEYKAGEGAFRPRQAAAYVDDLIRGRGTMPIDGVPRDGLVVMASDRDSAVAARDTLSAAIAARHAEERAHARVWVGYIDEDGKMQWLAPTWPRDSRPQSERGGDPP